MPTPTESINCWIYRSPLKAEMYLYLRAEGDFEAVPSELLQRFGTPEFVMQLQLHTGRRLAREEAARVMASLRERGFHLQMPPRTDPAALPEYRR